MEKTMLTGDFEITIEGEIDPGCALEFAPAAVTVAGGRTIVRAEAIDQAALHAIIRRVSGLGLTLLGVMTIAPSADRRRVPPHDPATDTTAPGENGQPPAHDRPAG
jgi:hypothetical protein